MSEVPFGELPLLERLRVVEKELRQIGAYYAGSNNIGRTMLSKFMVSHADVVREAADRLQELEKVH